MFEKANPGRDAFTFSLGGMRANAPFIATPAIAYDCLNTIWDERLSRVREDRTSTARAIENMLGRYFAPGCCRAA